MQMFIRWYSKYYGVYDIVNPELSSNQEILWNITEEDLANKTNANEQQSTEDDWIKDYFSRKTKKQSLQNKSLQPKQWSYLKTCMAMFAI